jgi:hypothetical protein
MSNFQRGIQTGTQQAESSLGKFAKNTASILGGAFAVDKAFSFASGAVSAASDMNESLSKTRTVFGESSRAIEMWAKNAAKNMGMSQGAALDVAGTFGNMFGQMGIASRDASNMTQMLGILASDLGSFHNADPTEVIESMTAAFRGEYDSVQRYVPTIRAAAVEQEALATTGKKAAKELTDQDKLLATYSLLMKGAGAATGDFARTSDSLANKQRIQAAQWENMKTQIGQGLLPVITKLTSFIMGTLLPGMMKLGNFISDNKSLFVALGVGITAALVPAFIAWAAAALPAAAATTAAAAPVIALGAVVAGAAYLIIKNWDSIKSGVSTAVEAVKGFIGGLIEKFQGIAGGIGSALSGVAGIITAPYRLAFNSIAKLWNNTVGKLSFKIPSWVPGIGGKGFDVPDIPLWGGGGDGWSSSGRGLGQLSSIPAYHTGGIVQGAAGHEVLARLMPGERVVADGSAPSISVTNYVTNPLSEQASTNQSLRDATFLMGYG